MTKPNALSLALRKSGAAVAATPAAATLPPAARVALVAEGEPAPRAGRAKPAKSPQPSREATAPITVHYPAHVRRQVKMMAAEQGRTMDDLIAEALNLMFVKYRKPEVAPRKGGTAA